jgi:hypothetical protein
MPNIRLLETFGGNIRLRPIVVNRNCNIRLSPAAVTLPGDITLGPVYPFRDWVGGYAVEIFGWTGTAWVRCPEFVWDGAAWVRAISFLRLGGRWGEINTTGMEM